MSRFTITSGFVVGAAVLGLTLATVFASASPPAQAEPEIASALHRPLSKADRLPVRTVGAACSSKGWPYYDQSCRFDLRTLDTSAPMVRVIALH
jgi:hypothetical protein